MRAVGHSFDFRYVQSLEMLGVVASEALNIPAQRQRLAVVVLDFNMQHGLRESEPRFLTFAFLRLIQNPFWHCVVNSEEKLQGFSASWLTLKFLVHKNLCSPQLCTRRIDKNAPDSLSCDHLPIHVYVHIQCAMYLQ